MLFILVSWLVLLLSILYLVHITNLFLLFFVVHLVINKIASSLNLFQYKCWDIMLVDRLAVNGYLFVIPQFRDDLLPLFLGNLSLSGLNWFE